MKRAQARRQACVEEQLAKRSFTGIAVLFVLATLSAGCSLLGLGGDFVSDGSATEPVPLGDVTSGPVSFAGEVASRESSYYVVDVWPGREYTVGVGDPAADVVLGIFDDSDFSDSLVIAELIEETVAWYEEVTPTGSRLFVRIDSDQWKGTGYALGVEDSDDYQTEGSVLLPIDLGDASSAPVERAGFTRGAGSYYRVTVAPDATYDVVISQVDNNLILAVGSDPDFEVFMETNPVYSATETTTVSTAGISALFIRVYFSGGEEFLLSVAKQ